MRFVQIIGSLWVFFLLSACTTTQVVGTPESDAAHQLSVDQTIGQTFVAQKAGLNAIEIYLEPGGATEGSLTLRLYLEPASRTELATSTLELGQITEPGYYRFPLPTALDSRDTYYYFELETALGADGSDPAAVMVDADTTGIDGSMYLNRQPAVGRVVFRPVYSLPHVLWGIAAGGYIAVKWLVVATLLFVIPGLGLIALTGVDRDDTLRLGHGERMMSAAGLGLAIYPVAFLWIYTLGIKPNILWYVWLPPLLGFVALATQYRWWTLDLRQIRPALSRWRHGRHLWADLGLLLAVGLIIAVRLLVIQSLDAPLWGDSVQHTVIAQLIGDHGGLFESWQPYAPYQSLTVHFGFSALVALFASTIGTTAPLATLIMGQIINALAVFTLYPLAVRLANGNRWAGVGALVGAGLISMMPAFYVNWGRYPQLAGQAIMPAALWLLWLTFWHAKINIRLLLLAGLVLAGMALTYYRMAYYYSIFVLCWVIFWGIPRWRLDAGRWTKIAVGLMGIASIAGTLFLPWLPRLLNSPVGQAAMANAPTTTNLQQVIADYQIWRQISDFVSPELLVLCGIAAVWGLLRRDFNLILIVAWAVGLSLLAASRLVNLPGSAFLANFAILIALYMPAGLLVGWLTGQIALLAERRNAQPLLLLAITIVALWSAKGQIGIVDSQFIMVTRPDRRAMDWIEQNVPTDALFLVEGFSIYNRLSAVGADAGWWIPVLAGRSNTMPPQYALLSETPEQPGHTELVTELVTTIEDHTITSPQSLAALCEWGVTHVYIGQGQGEVGFGVNQLFTPDELAESPAFQPIYHEDRVQVFALDRSVCGSPNG